MKLSDISVTRPVFATVLSLILIIFGFVSFSRLSLREYPDINPPIISVEVNYPGASANVVESKITEIVEERIAGIEGIEFIESKSEDGRSTVNVEFSLSRDIDSAANDIRDRVSGALGDFPDEADPPEIQKIDSNEDVIMWLNLTSPQMTVPELTDYASRYLVDRFSTLDGVGRVRIGGGQEYAMRVWLDREALAARNLTVTDVENALRAENIELPAGSIESNTRQFTVRLQRAFRVPEDFMALSLGRSVDGYITRLGDVARVEKGSIENRTFFRGNGAPMIGIGIVKQSTANTISVARAAKAQAKLINSTLPNKMKIEQSYDSSIFIEEAIGEVYLTFIVAIILVVLVIYIFIGDVRGMIIPAITVPISIISSFIALYAFGYSINLLTLLALVLAIGLVVDDAIIVLENISRRMTELGETPLVAAYRGTQEVGMAVIATTLVLVAVFVPLAFIEGDIGRLFSEFSMTMAVAVVFSSIVALTLCPMLASKLLKRDQQPTKIYFFVEKYLSLFQSKYIVWLEKAFNHSYAVIGIFAGLLVSCYLIFISLPSEYAPKEDRGTFAIMVNGPEGASHKYMADYMDEIEARLLPYIEAGEISRLLVRTPRTFGTFESFNTGMIMCGLTSWSERRSAFVIMDEIKNKLSDLTGVRAVPIMRQGFGAGNTKVFQFVIGGGTYQELAEWRDILLKKLEVNNPGFEGIDWDYKETKPQIQIKIDYNTAAELGVKYSEIGRTLESMLGSKRVTTYIEEGEEYDVILQGERNAQRDSNDLQNMYVRSERTGQLIPLANLVTLTEFSDSATLNRYNRIRAITIESNLAAKYSLGEALEYMENLVRNELPEKVIIDYKGQSQDFKFAGQSIIFVFILGILITFLILAAQFESFIHPFIIMLSVPTAVAGGLLGLFIMGSSLNLYSQIGLVMLVGLAAKNGILIVEFANQLRDQGMEFDRAIREASRVRLRPILMTGITTAAGAIPLIIAFGAGAETRFTIGVVVFFGILIATFLTIFLVPVAYSLLARKTGSPGAVQRRLDQEINLQDK